MSKFIKFILLLSIMMTVVSCSWFGEAAAVAKEEVGPRAALKKYEWFKDASATIDEKFHTINIYEQNKKDMFVDYESIPRKDWDRLDKRQYNQWAMEITGIKASYNKVVKEYNAASSKFNWDLFNTDEIPHSYDLYLDK